MRLRWYKTENLRVDLDCVNAVIVARTESAWQAQFVINSGQTVVVNGRLDEVEAILKQFDKYKGIK